VARKGWADGLEAPLNKRPQNSQTPIRLSTVVVDNLWVSWRPGTARPVPKLPNSLEEYQFSGILFGDVVWSPGRDPVNASREVGWFPPLFFSWLRAGQLVGMGYLEMQVEREGSMDWLSLLIPLKLVVFCVILVVIYRMLSGWNSAKLLKLPGAASQCSCTCSCWSNRAPGN
jgi:hypothetical protein